MILKKSILEHSMIDDKKSQCLNYASYCTTTCEVKFD